MKYEMIPAGTLYRIRALKDFCGIHAGDLGGLVENNENLSQQGDCWIFDDARVLRQARVSGDAWVCNKSLVNGRARIGGQALIMDFAHVADDAQVNGYGIVSCHGQVWGHAIVCGQAQVGGYGTVTEDAKVSMHGLVGAGRISGGSIVTRPVRMITGLEHEIIITDNTLIIGNDCRPFHEWGDHKYKKLVEELQCTTYTS